MSQQIYPDQDALEKELDRYSVPANPLLYQKEDGHYVRCFACAHQCRIADKRRGICRLRHNRDGMMFAPSGYVAGLQVDPIEKKPFYHVLPGSGALSFGMLGCNFHCEFCQNWVSSQTLRDNDALSGFRPCSSDTIVDSASRHNAASVISTYNEPLITADWAAEIFEKAKARGLLCGFVSNGFATRTVLEFLRPVMDIFKVDLKCFSEENYRRLGGGLKPVLDSIGQALELGFWVEIVTLVVPGFNDTPEELDRMAAFIASLSVDIPWHVTAFYPTYRMSAASPTSFASLDTAWNAGKDAGLRYVYAGNMGGRAGDKEHTWCPDCGTLLVQRRGFQVGQNRITERTCPDCGAVIAGRWN